jgi:hypothetical protein
MQLDRFLGSLARFLPVGATLVAAQIQSIYGSVPRLKSHPPEGNGNCVTPGRYEDPSFRGAKGDN